jgi:hypothetical protein
MIICYIETCDVDVLNNEFVTNGDDEASDFKQVKLISWDPKTSDLADPVMYCIICNRRSRVNS